MELNDTASLVTLSPAFSEVTIPAGSLGSRPRLPDDDAKTVSTSYRLMARSDLDRSPVSEVAEYLFQMRSRIAKHAPVINLMKAPDDDTADERRSAQSPGRDRLLYARAADLHGSLRRLGLACLVLRRRRQFRCRMGRPGAGERPAGASRERAQPPARDPA